MKCKANDLLKDFEWAVPDVDPNKGELTDDEAPSDAGFSEAPQTPQVRMASSTSKQIRTTTLRATLVIVTAISTVRIITASARVAIAMTLLSCSMFSPI